jgi:protein required for attachment to host cells
VAPPDFLGLLRKALNTQLNKLVDREVPKNLAQMNAVEIREHLPEFLS